MRYIILLLALIIIPVKGFNQHILVLEKEGKAKRTRYFIGDQITFRAGPQQVLYSGAVVAITDTTFTVRDKAFRPSEVSTFVYPQRKKSAKTIRKAAFSSAFTMFVIAGLDRGINQKAKPLYDPPTLNLVGGFTLFGLLTYLVPEKKIKIPQQQTLRIINITPG
jgi:hypothetical protein